MNVDELPKCLLPRLCKKASQLSLESQLACQCVGAIPSVASLFSSMNVLAARELITEPDQAKDDALRRS